jgi:hypothetical protein
MPRGEGRVSPLAPSPASTTDVVSDGVRYGDAGTARLGDQQANKLTPPPLLPLDKVRRKTDRTHNLVSVSVFLCLCLPVFGFEMPCPS